LEIDRKILEWYHSEPPHQNPRKDGPILIWELEIDRKDGPVLIMLIQNP
jgi:hypothetical protein